MNRVGQHLIANVPRQTASSFRYVRFPISKYYLYVLFCVSSCIPLLNYSSLITYFQKYSK